MADELPDWLPDNYDPDAPVADRLPIMADIEGGIELHSQGQTGATTVLGRPKHATRRADEGYMQLCVGKGPAEDTWDWEIELKNGEVTVYKVDPEQEASAYDDTKRSWHHNADIRIYGVDHDRLNDSA